MDYCITHKKSKLENGICPECGWKAPANDIVIESSSVVGTSTVPSTSVTTMVGKVYKWVNPEAKSAKKKGKK
jgi:hypothetical protein